MSEHTAHHTTENTDHSAPATAAHHHTPELSSIPDLFKKSWSVLTDALFNALMISIGSAVSSFLLIVVGFLAALLMLPALTGSSIGQIFSDSFDPTTLLTPQFFIGSGVFMLVFLIIASIISAAFSSAFVLAFFHAADKPRVRDLIKQGFGVAGWFVVYGIVSSLLVLGGFGFLVLPAIAMGIFFMFGTYEVIVAKKKPIAALQRSTTVVIEHFGDIFVRMILFFLLNVAVVYLLPAIFSAISEEAGAIYSVINMIISIVLSWYGTAYGIQLYKEASAATPETKKRSGVFMTLVGIAALGYIGVLSIAAITLRNLPEDFPNISELAQSSTTESNPFEDQVFLDMIADANTVESSCGFDLHLPTTSADDGTNRYWIYEERPVAPAAFRGLIPDNQMGSGPLAAVVSFKSNDDRFGDAQNFNLGFPGYNIFCIDNVNEYDLDGFVAAAQEAEGKTVELDGETEEWGAVTVQPTYVSGLDASGDYYKEPLYLGVVPGADSKLVVFIPWGTSADDEMKSQISEDMTFIRNTFSYYSEEEMRAMFEELNPLNAQDDAETTQE